MYNLLLIAITTNSLFTDLDKEKNTLEKWKKKKIKKSFYFNFLHVCEEKKYRFQFEPYQISILFPICFDHSLLADSQRGTLRGEREWRGKKATKFYHHIVCCHQWSINKCKKAAEWWNLISPKNKNKSWSIKVEGICWQWCSFFCHPTDTTIIEHFSLL